MPYTVRQLADLAGVSPRTFRYYDQIGLLKPGATSEAGYRLYGAARSTGCSKFCFIGNWGLGWNKSGECCPIPPSTA